MPVLEVRLKDRCVLACHFSLCLAASAVISLSLSPLLLRLRMEHRVRAHAAEIFRRADRDASGALSHTELKRLLHEHADLRTELQAAVGGGHWKVRCNERLRGRGRGAQSRRIRLREIA